MTSIIVPKLVGMDTSTLIGIASGLCDAEPEHRRGDQRGGLGRVPPQLGGGRRSDQEGPLAAGPGGSQLLPEQ